MIVKQNVIRVDIIFYDVESKDMLGIIIARMNVVRRLVT